MEPLNETDKLVREFVKDQAKFVMVWQFETETEETYYICQDQNGGEWIEE